MSFSDRICRANVAAKNRFFDHSVQVSTELAAPAIYDAPFRKEGGYEGQVETTAPACTLTDADVARLDLGHGSYLTVSKNEVEIGKFEVIGVEPDGFGLIRLTLAKE